MTFRVAALAASLAAANFLAAVCGGEASAQVNVTTYHYDMYRTGWDSAETTLTQSSVNKASFGLLAVVPLDDQVDAQPLLVNNVNLGGVQHNVLYVVTENDTVYALDAQSGQVLLQTSLGTPVSYPQGCDNNGPHVGINSTPVIDAELGVLYVIAYTLENSVPTYTLHALSLETLLDTVTPAVVAATGTLSNGKSYQFNAATQRQRPALLLANSTIYAGFGSFCDYAANDSRGWVLGWQESALTPLAAGKLTNTRPRSPDAFFLSSVWMSGYGLAANAAGSIYFVTGNSDFSGTTYRRNRNVAESAVEMTGDLSTVQGLFTPADHGQLDQADADFGSGGLLLLPPQQGTYPDIAAAAGKDGNLYLLNADNLRKPFGAYQIGGCWCGQSYYQGSDGAGRIVTSGSNTTVQVWELSDQGTPALTSVSQYGGIADGMDPGFFTSVSSNGTAAGSAIVWAVGRPTDANTSYVDLYAVDPDNGALLFSETAGQWKNLGGNSNIVPVVANGLVYVASDQVLTIFGPGGTATPRFPAVRRADLPPLRQGEHEVYAKAVGVSGSLLIAHTRTGATIRIDPTAAKAQKRFAVPAVGAALAAVGRYNKSGILAATAIRHAKYSPAMWPADR